MNDDDKTYALRRAAGACAVALFLTATGARAQTGDASLDSVIAERLALIAEDSAAKEDTPEPLLRESAAMLEMARLYNPNEIRFARALVDLQLRLGESEDALQTLGVVRQLDPKDQLAMIQFIDLSANRMETGEQRVDYLRQIVDAKGVAAEVRAHAAVKLMDTYFQRSQDSQGLAALDTALSLNPQNITALATRYRLAAQSGSAAERVRALAALMQASPANQSHVVAMAQECAAAGDYENAGNYYLLSFAIAQRQGQVPAIEDLVDYTATQMFANRVQSARSLVEQCLETIKNDGRVYTLDLLLAQHAGRSDEELKPMIEAARGVYLAQLAGLSLMLSQPDAKEMPATAPAVPMPDLAADVRRIKAGGENAERLSAAYTIALTEQLWFDLYFKAAPVEDSSLNALRGLLGDEDPIVVRFEGWRLLSAGKFDEARVKFEAVADRDGFAKLGLIATEIARDATDKAKSQLNELLKARPTGMLAAHAAVAGKRLGTSVEMTVAEAEVAQVAAASRAVVNDTVSNPRGSYLLTADPLKVSVGFGEPILARVTLLNNGRAPITIGPGGLVSPRFVVDVQIRGDGARTIAGASSGRWAGAVRLLPRQSISQIVRIDRGEAYAFFNGFPTPQIPFSAFVTVNPVPTQRQHQPGPGGEQAQIGSAMERRSAPLHIDAFRSAVIGQLSSGAAVERLNAMQLLNSVIPVLKQQGDNAQAQKVAEQLGAVLDERLAAEPIADVKDWMSFMRAASEQPGTQAAIGEKMADSASTMGKLSALLTARSLPAPQRKAIAQRVLAQPDIIPSMRALAEAVAVQDDLPQPAATQPSDGGTGGSGTGGSAAPPPPR